jgi:hypothetical protein
MVFHSDLQFWPGSAVAVCAVTNVVAINAALIPAAARRFFFISSGPLMSLGMLSLNPH